MARKMLDEVDGFVVDEYAGVFSGTFDVSVGDSRYMAFDDEVLLVVRARVKVPRLKETPSGDIIRINVLGVKEAAVVRSEQLKTQLCENLGLDRPATQIPLIDGATGEAAPSAQRPLEEPAAPLEQAVIEMEQPPVPGRIAESDSDDGEPDFPVRDSRLASFLAE